MADQDWLSVAEVDEMCAPLVNKAAQLKYLRSMGLTAHRRPHNGTILLLRAHRDAVMSGQAAAAPPATVQARQETRQPDRAAMLAAFGKTSLRAVA